MNERTPSRGGTSAGNRADFARAYAEGRILHQEDWKRCNECGKTGTHIHDSRPTRPAAGADCADGHVYDLMRQCSRCGYVPDVLDDVIDEVLKARRQRAEEGNNARE